MSLFSIEQIPEKYRSLGEIEYIGQGSIGTVYRIKGEGKEYALKIMSCGSSEEKYQVANKEAQVLKHLEGAQHIIKPFDISEIEEDGNKTVFILEEYGVSMPEYIKSIDMSVSGAISIIIGIAKAIQECKQYGVLHLDIQPQNIFIDRNGQILLGDFSSALFENELSENNKIRGTWAFMAPEVYRKKECSTQSDLYSLGVLAYWILNRGKIPFVSEDGGNTAIYKRLAGAPFPELTFSDNKLQTEINEIIKSLCAFERLERYSSIEEVIEKLSVIWDGINSGVFQDFIIEDHRFATSSAEEESFASKPLLPRSAPLVRIEKNSGTRKRQLLIFIIDLSKKDDESYTAMVNAAMDKFCYLIKNDKESFDQELKVVFMNTADKNVWMSTPEVAMDLDDVIWTYQEASGESRLGRTLSVLNKALSRDVLFHFDGKKAQPIIIYVGDGYSFDDWRSELSNILNNRWFDCSKRIVVPLGDKGDVLFKKLFVSDEKYILDFNHVESLFPFIDSRTLHTISLPPSTEGDLGNSSELHDSFYGLWNVDPIATTAVLWNKRNDDSADYDLFSELDDDETKIPEALPDNPYEVKEQIICSNCGRLIDDEKFCPNCGTKVIHENGSIKVSKVNFSAVAPASVIKGEYSLIDVIMYEEQFRKVVDEIIARSESEVKETKSSAVNVVEKARIKMIISTPDFEIEDDTEEREWIGEYLDFSFSVMVPKSLDKKQILFTITVFINNIMSTRLKFTAKITEEIDRQDLEIHREDVKSVFVSFAEQDKNRAMHIMQGVQLIRPDMDIFMDADKLRLRKDYDYAVKKEIDYRDSFYLCWSGFARKSEQVEFEWRYALESKGITGIEPLPLALPDNCPPPDELKGKHFNDKLFIHIGEKSFDFNNEKIQIRKNIYLDKAGRVVNIKGKTIRLTKLEYLTFECLANNVGRTLSNDTLARYAWGDDYYAGMGDDSNVRRIIKQLRSKIGADVIENSPGLGYKISKEKVLDNISSDPFDTETDWI